MYIYKIENLKNNKVYIGQTINKVEYRWHQHIHGENNSNSLVKKAIKKYGVENFSFEVIYEAQNIEELNFQEEKLVKSLDALVPNGYNLIAGGRNYKPSYATRRKMSNSAKGKSLSEEHKNKIRLGNTGKKMSEEAKRKCSTSKLGKKNPAYGKSPINAKAVYANNDTVGWFFKSISEAEKFGFNPSNIVAACKGRLKTHKGFQWTYLSFEKGK